MADPIPLTDPEPQFGPMPAFVKEARERRAAGMDKSVAEAQRDALAAALASLLGQASGMASYLPVGASRKAMLSDFSRLSSERMADASEALSEAAANEDLGILGEAAARLPVSAVGVLPEMYNPFGKAAHVTKLLKGVDRVAKHAPDVLNAAWHAARGYKSDGPTGAAIAAGSNVAGEKIIEPFMGFAGKRFGIPYDLAGNAVGAALETILNESRRVQED